MGFITGRCHLRPGRLVLHDLGEEIERATRYGNLIYEYNDFISAEKLARPQIRHVYPLRRLVGRMQLRVNAEYINPDRREGFAIRNRTD